MAARLVLLIHATEKPSLEVFVHRTMLLGGGKTDRSKMTNAIWRAPTRLLQLRDQQ